MFVATTSFCIINIEFFLFYVPFLYKCNITIININKIFVRLLLSLLIVMLTNYSFKTSSKHKNLPVFLLASSSSNNKVMNTEKLDLFE
ncbi:hypothetical protein DERF_001637 [Dermatophagoides farinae]|uniref:Uncharacterized protein n=1 Tax=Dermatophagoides farinae TaxID=6954 RepID=A0A922I9X4_DERFA|nr:hypothetical protein DERF_001637 [Dermatophagoides farinae]